MTNIILGSQLTGVERCPQCQVAAPSYTSIFGPQALPDDPHETDIVRLWGLHQCNSCKQLVLVRGGSYFSSFGSSSKDEYATRLFPQNRAISNDIPESARNYLRQATETVHAADASVMMSAAAVDSMLKAKGFTEGTLYARIGTAVSDGVLTQEMSQWAHAVRLESNNVRHADDQRPHMSREDAEQTLTFAEALGDFLFTLNARVEAGIRRAEAK